VTQSFSISSGGPDRLFFFFEQTRSPRFCRCRPSLASREIWLTNQAGLAPAEGRHECGFAGSGWKKFSATVIGFKEEDLHIPEVEFRAKRLTPEADPNRPPRWQPWRPIGPQLGTIPNRDKKIRDYLYRTTQTGMVGSEMASGLDTPVSHGETVGCAPRRWVTFNRSSAPRTGKS